jgi:hypothetical protein
MLYTGNQVLAHLIWKPVWKWWEEIMTILSIKHWKRKIIIAVTVTRYRNNCKLSVIIRRLCRYLSFAGSWKIWISCSITSGEMLVHNENAKIPYHLLLRRAYLRPAMEAPSLELAVSLQQLRVPEPQRGWPPRDTLPLLRHPAQANIILAATSH